MYRKNVDSSKKRLQNSRQRVEDLDGSISPFDHFQRLTTILPKLWHISLSLLKTAGWHVARIYGRTCQYLSGFMFWIPREEKFLSSTRGKSLKIVNNAGWWDYNPRPLSPWSIDDAILLINKSTLMSLLWTKHACYDGGAPTIVFFGGSSTWELEISPKT